MWNSVETMSLKRCRSCMSVSNGGQTLYNLAEQLLLQAPLSYAELFSLVTGITAVHEDGLPDLLCEACVQKLLQAYYFIQTSKDSDKALRQEIIDNTIKNERSDDSLDDVYVEDNCIESSIVNDNTKDNFKCIKCEQVFKNRNLLNKHIRNNHSDRLDKIIYPCEICGKQFNRKNGLMVHSRIHTGEKPFACEYCPMRFTQSGGLIDHRKIHTGEKPYICNVCSKVFFNRSSFTRHKRVHTKEKPYSCKICNKAFSHSSSLKQHIFVHTDERPLICDLCGKRMKSKFDMKQHTRMHKEKGFVCEQCGKKIGTKAHLEHHIKKMHSDISGHCSHCGKDTSDLKEHMLIHSDDPVYCCHFCGQKYKQKSNLTYHIRLHMNAEKFKCDLDGCGKAFPKRSMLDFHLHKHHYNEYPHMCQFCSKGYFRTSDLSRHLNTIHPLENKVNDNEFIIKNE